MPLNRFLLNSLAVRMAFDIRLGVWLSRGSASVGGVKDRKRLGDGQEEQIRTSSIFQFLV